MSTLKKAAVVKMLGVSLLALTTTNALANNCTYDAKVGHYDWSYCSLANLQDNKCKPRSITTIKKGRFAGADSYHERIITQVMRARGYTLVEGGTAALSLGLRELRNHPSNTVDALQLFLVDNKDKSTFTREVGWRTERSESNYEYRCDFPSAEVGLDVGIAALMLGNAGCGRKLVAPQSSQSYSEPYDHVLLRRILNKVPMCRQKKAQLEEESVPSEQVSESQAAT